MPETNTTKWAAWLNNPQTFFNQYDPCGEKAGEDALFKGIAQNIVQRDEMILRYFYSAETPEASVKALEKYISSHKSKDLVMKRMRTEVKAKYFFIKSLSNKTQQQQCQQILNLWQMHPFSDSAPIRTSKNNSRGNVKDSITNLPRLVIKDVDDTTAISAYDFLVLINCVEVNHILPEIPENISLSDYKRLFSYHTGDFKKVTTNLQAVLKNHGTFNDLDPKDREFLLMYERLLRQALLKQYELGMRWLNLSGRELDLSSPPRLGEFANWKAPVPARLGWSDKLYGLEAKQMGHSPALNNANSDTSEPIKPNDPDTRESKSNAIINQSDTVQAIDPNYISALYELAGGKLPKQPLDGDDRFTFPGKLSRHENIFYDYSLVIPVECSDTPCMNKVEGSNPRDIMPAQVLAAKAGYVLSVLRDGGFASVLGSYDGKNVVDHIDYLLTNSVLNLGIQSVTNLDVERNVSLVRDVKKQLKKMAGLMRLISRTEVLFNPITDTPDNPANYLVDLQNAIKGFPGYGLRDTLLPSTDISAPIIKKTMYFNEGRDFDYFPDDGRKNQDPITNADDPADNGPKNMHVPDALSSVEAFGGTVSIEPIWTHEGAQRYDLRNYVIYLGDRIAPALVHLIDFANKMAGAVATFQADSTASLKWLAEGKIHKAIMTLAELLDEIADQIPLPKATNGEGSIRLALQVIFRQYWFPEAYVMGKLVGYKNLIPNQKETMKRRTFVKTTRETTSAEEFATARQDDYSRSQKETSEVIKESSKDFGFTMNASGHFDAKIWGVAADTQTKLGLSQKSKVAQNLITESAAKGSANYSNKREVKVRELIETEEAQETTIELQNMNQEITANYFYYQLLRQYRVTVALQDIKPVLLRTRDVPSPTEIDDHFVSTYAHILLHHLPNQLSTDAQESADKLELLARALIRCRAEMDQRSAELAVFKDQRIPSIEEKDAYNAYQQKNLELQNLVSEARKALASAEDEYTRIRAKMNRVLKHLRENICYYMQYIWQESPPVDQDMILQEEHFLGESLPNVTRGLLRQGYHGNEEIFDYTGPSSELFASILENLRPGVELLYGLLMWVEGEPIKTGTQGEQTLTHHYIFKTGNEESISFSPNAKVKKATPVEDVDYVINYQKGTITFINPLDDVEPQPTMRYITYEKFVETSLYQYLTRYYATEDMDALLDKITGLAFTNDPANPHIENPAYPDESLTTQSVQIAQDALIVETMPGEVPLLEGFKMAHRMLDVQKASLENMHLSQRIADKPWKVGGEDSYAVRRYDGTVPAEKEVKEVK